MNTRALLFALLCCFGIQASESTKLMACNTHLTDSVAIYSYTNTSPQGILTTDALILKANESGMFAPRKDRHWGLGIMIQKANAIADLKNSTSCSRAYGQKELQWGRDYLQRVLMITSDSHLSGLKAYSQSMEEFKKGSTAPGEEKKVLAQDELAG